MPSGTDALRTFEPIESRVADDETVARACPRAAASPPPLRKPCFSRPPGRLCVRGVRTIASATVV